MQLRRGITKLLQSTGLNFAAHKLYYKYIHGFETATKEILPAQERCFDEAVSAGTATRGDYLEFGLFKGYSFWHAQMQARRRGLEGMRFLGFDSFAGLPAIGTIDQTRNSEFFEGQYACSKEAVTQNLDSGGVDWRRTFLIEGYFSDSLVPEVKTRYGLERAAIVLIDCDLYESTADVLRFIDDLLGDGTVLLFDDWNCFDRDDNRGQRRALREFLERKPRWRMEPFFSYGIYGQVFIVREQQ